MPTQSSGGTATRVLYVREYISTFVLIADAHSVARRKNKLVLAIQRLARGNTHAQELTGAVDLEQLRGARISLLANCGFECPVGCADRGIKSLLDGLRPQGKRRRAIRTIHRANANCPTGGAVATDFTAQKIRLPYEMRGVSSSGMRIDFTRRGDLLKGAIPEERDAIGERHGFVLIVRDEKKRDADFALQGFQLTLHLLAQVGVKRGKWLVQEQELRAIDK